LELFLAYEEFTTCVVKTIVSRNCVIEEALYGQKNFNELVEAYIIPIFSGAYIKGETPSSKSEHIVASSNGYSSILVKPMQKDDYRFQISRAQPFEKGDEKLVESNLT
jgi:hypothetical protein